MLEKCIRKAKVSYYNDLFNEKKTSILNMWKQLGAIINPEKRKKMTQITSLIENEELITDARLLPDIMNNYFCNIGPSLKSAIPSHDPGAFKKYLPNPTSNSFFLPPVTYEEILKEIKKLDPKKSCWF